VKVIFEGHPPFHLPVAQSATATAVDDTVEVTLSGLIDEQGPLPVPIRVRMTWKVAQKLIEETSRAALIAESRAR
jgi:hypothetical protein